MIIVIIIPIFKIRNKKVKRIICQLQSKCLQFFVAWVAYIKYVIVCQPTLISSGSLKGSGKWGPYKWFFVLIKYSSV